MTVFNQKQINQIITFMCLSPAKCRSIINFSM